MIIQEFYRFPYRDFNDEGMNPESGECFPDLIDRWEHLFHLKHPAFYANHLFANPATMVLLKCSMNHEENEDFGMELINGQIDMEQHFLIDEHSKRTTIYALGSFIEENLDEPLFLIMDDTIKDGNVILKFISGNDDDDTEMPVYIPWDYIKCV